MNQIKLGTTPVFDFTTSDPTNQGAVSDADSTPTIEVFEDATDTAILTPTAVKRTGKTGNYRVAIAATTGNGFDVGKSYNVVASATVGGVAGKGLIGQFIVQAGDITEVLASLQNAAITIESDGLTGSILIYVPGTAQSVGNLLRTIPLTRADTTVPFSLARVS